jgi:LysM repeat protein
MTKNSLFRAKISLLLAVMLVAFILPATVQAQGSVHVVSYGDTLYSIARRYGTSVDAIMRTNGLSNRNFIWVGQRLAPAVAGAPTLVAGAAGAARSISSAGATRSTASPGATAPASRPS